MNADVLPAGAALLIVYKHYVVLNRQAAELLQICKYVQFADVNGYVRISATLSPAGHRADFRNKACRINSTALARWLSEKLAGPGVYRIQQEYTVLDERNETWYEIFMRRYDFKIK